MNERTAAAQMYAEMGLSESAISQLQELAEPELQSNEAEILDDAFGEPSDQQDVGERIRPLCNHLFGQTPSRPAHLCGSPALRGEDFCYYHHPTRKPVREPNERRARRIARQAFNLPLPTTRRELQNALCVVANRIAHNQIDPRRSFQLLMALQTAALNLPNLNPVPDHPKPQDRALLL
jgi:hypothetical protein